LVVAYIHNEIESALEICKYRIRIGNESIARCRRDWARIPLVSIDPPPDFRPVSLDLDVFGHASLSQLFGTVRTAVGLPVLGRWLSRAASPEEVAMRQEAVTDFTRMTDWREPFQLRCCAAAESPVGSEDFLAWMAQPGWLSRRPWFLWIAPVLAGLTSFSAVAFFTGWIPPEIAGVSFLLLLALNFLLTVFLSGKVHEIFEQVSSRRNEVDQYVHLFEMLASIPAWSARLIHLRDVIAKGDRSALQGMKRLSQIVWLGNLRRHGILFLVYLFLQFTILWDVFTLFWLEKWQAQHRDVVPDWFNALGQAEVLAAMGTVAYENPEWTLPQLEKTGFSGIEAQQMGHPLLVEHVRVDNDIDLGPRGTVLIITGSNMSGKSTMLRSVGLNVVLAQMGSVVCASQMKLQPVELETSMRIDDSLAEGVSFFMAELRRLKQIVDRSLETKNNGRQFLFLLDEILQGTNSRERHIAVGAVIRQLLGNGAIGAFTTHDLDLARESDLAARSRVVYFTESFSQTPSGNQMTFDYVMRDGIAPSTNALKLLKMVGLRPADEATERGTD
jgi:hypothetical protein